MGQTDWNQRIIPCKRTLTVREEGAWGKRKASANPPTHGLRSWRNCFWACESFGHSRGLGCEKRPPHSPHGFAVPLPKTLLMLHNTRTPAGYPGHRRVLLCSRRPHLCSKLTTFQNQFRSIWNARALRPYAIHQRLLGAHVQSLLRRLSSPALILERKGV